MPTPRKILAIKLRALGDTVLMTAPLLELRQAFPGAEIHVVTLTQWAPILETHPAINKLWAFDRHSDRSARAQALARMAYRLRKERFDCVVNFHASPSSSILSFATGAKIRSIHFHGHRDKNRYSTVPIPGKGTLKPIIERDMDTVRALGVHVPAGRMPQITLQAAELAQARDHLKRLKLTGPVLGIGLGASRPSKSWPVERFAELAIAWCRKKNGSAIAIAGPDEAERARELLKAVDAQFSSASDLDPAVRARIATETQLPLRRMAALLGALSVYVGNDSGPKHVAVAAGTPTVTLFGPEHPFEWHPYPPSTHPFLFVEHLACRKDADPGMPEWCAVHDCVTEQHRCMRLLGVDQALTEALRIAR